MKATTDILVVNRIEGRFLPKEKAVNSRRNDMEAVFKDVNKRQEYLVRYSKPGD